MKRSASATQVLTWSSIRTVRQPKVPGTEVKDLSSREGAEVLHSASIKGRAITSSFEEEREAFGAALNWIEDSNCDPDTVIMICTDSQSLATALKGDGLETTHPALNEACNLTDESKPITLKSAISTIKDLRSFKDLPTNMPGRQQPMQMNPVEDPTCPKCHEAPETLEDWLLECPGTLAARQEIFGTTVVGLAILSQDPHGTTMLAKRCLYELPSA